MYSLPPLAPQDSHALWYTTSSSHLQHDTPAFDHNPTPAHQQQHARRHHHHHRTPLYKLRQDEEILLRRKENIRNYGNSWIKPPGISKTLHQQHEDKREALEHEEGLRREALAAELAEAEAGNMADMIPGEEEMEMEGRDLDDEVPDAEVEVTALEGDTEDEEDEDEDDSEGEGMPPPPMPFAAQFTDNQQFRQVLMRGEDHIMDGGAVFLRMAEEEEDASALLQEEDLVGYDQGEGGGRDLDDEIPDAETEGYEHTDTEEELSSSEMGDESGFPRAQATASSMVRSDGTQNSMDLSGMLSGSSQVGSSPQMNHHQAGGGFRGRRSGH